jgi:Flp pilus assembly protein TadD
MRTTSRRATASLIIFGSLLLSACNSTGSFGNNDPTIELPTTVEKYPDDEVLRVAKAEFAAGKYGHAARYYERAVEITPNDGEAWLGLAASYDRIRRFDLADRAYREAARYVGGQAEYYNNIGYSYLLRGDLLKARSSFLRARELDPSNVTVNNNLELLRDNVAQLGRR